MAGNRKLRVRSWLANLTLVLVSTLLGYFIAEMLFFRVLLLNVELKARPHLTELAEVLVQTSKRTSTPHDYLAILGDSYAEGVGDWLHTIGRNESLPFHSAHIIHQLTGLDVVSFGKAGAGSAEAMVLLPQRVMAATQCLVFPSIEPPSRIAVYFYEGNDIQDNLAFLRKVKGAYGAASDAAIDAFLAQEYANFAWWRCHLYLADVSARIAKFLSRYYASGRPGKLPTLPRNRPELASNAVAVAGEAVGVPTALEGPALELEDEAIVLGMKVFERSLDWLRRRFPEIPITIVYVPAPLSIYRNVRASVVYVVQPADAGESDISPVERIDWRSDQICDLARKVSGSLGVGFLDARPMLRAAAMTRLLHGPLDWGHFNENGYRALGKLVATTIDDPWHRDSCHQSSETAGRG